MRPQYGRGRWLALAHGGQSAHRHAMNPGLMTDIGKEASVARSGSIHDCNLHSSRAQFIEGANRVFDRQIDAS